MMKLASGRSVFALAVLAAFLLVVPNGTKAPATERMTGALASAADEVHYSYLDGTTVAFDWRGGSNEISYGSTSNYGHSIAASSPKPAPFSSAGPFWEAVISGLDPGTTYHYSIGGSADRTFATAPTGNFRFDVEADIGDSGSYPNMATTQTQIASDAPDLVITPGDLTYGNDHGQQAVDQHFNDVMAWSQTAAYMPAWGNHEWDSSGDDLRNYKGRFALPHAAGSPGAPTLGCCGEDWGWFDAGGVRFISYPEPYTSATWSDWSLKASVILAAAQVDPSVRYIVTFGHRPAYSTGHHPGSTTLADILDGLGDKYSKYVLNINGHSHDYERFVPIHGVTHITAGGGGATLETPWTSDDPRTAFRAFHLVHLRVDVTASAMDVEAVCGPATSNDDLTCPQDSIMDKVTIPVPSATGTVTDKPPVAALSVSPLSGLAPLLVTADAAASTDTDATPIATYRFDFGDGTVVGPQSGATASHTYAAAGTETVKVTVTDTASLSATDTSQVTVTASAAESPPVAALSVSPLSGLAPLLVTADAAASTDTDATPIATYRFDFGDGTVVGPQSGATAVHTYEAAGTYTVTLDVTDAAGLSSSTIARVTATTDIVANLITNPGFELNTLGWNAKLYAGITITRVPGGHSGGYAVEATNTTTTTQPECPLNDAPNWIAATVAGTYEASLWVRADTPGTLLELRIREYKSDTFVSSAQSYVVLDTTWQQIRVSYSPRDVGSTLDYNAFTWNAPPGTCFIGDDASIGLSGPG
jgi:PKD repeat protein